MKSAVLFFSLVALLFISCDGGLSLPPDVEPGITGVITVVSPWPAPQQDSVKNLWIFASQIFPLDSSKIVQGIFDGKIFIYPSFSENLQYDVNTQPFNFPLPPGTYFYIGVLQRFQDPFVDPRSYRVVAVYHESQNPGIPKTVIVKEFEVVSGINMTVDFYSLPPQPF